MEYDYDMKQRLQLEKKSDMKKRGLSSPDSADALALTYAFDIDITARDEVYVNHLTAKSDYALDDYI